MYKKGQGVPQDKAQAAEWSIKAFKSYQVCAKAGDSFAQYLLADMYENGRGVKTI